MKQILVLWEGANWAELHPLIDAGKLPHLAKLIEGGASGALAGLEPANPSAGAVSLATGLGPVEHQVFGKYHSNHDRELHETGSHDWVPFWKALSSEKLSCVSLGWPLTHPLSEEDGQALSDRFAWPSQDRQYRFTVPLESVNFEGGLRQKICAGRVLSTELDLEVLREFYGSGSSGKLPDSRRLNEVRKALAANFTFHAAALSLLEVGQPDFLALSYPGLEEILKSLPLIEGRLPERDRFYQLHDQLLGVLLQSLDEKTLIHVVSSVSYQPVPNGRLEAVPGGVWIMNGPDVKKDSLIQCGKITEVAPTVMWCFGKEMSDELCCRPRQDLFHRLANPSVQKVSRPSCRKKNERLSLPWSHLNKNPRERSVMRRELYLNPGRRRLMIKELGINKCCALRQMRAIGEFSELSTKLYHLAPNDPVVVRLYGEGLVQTQKWEALEMLVAKIHQENFAADLRSDLRLLDCERLKSLGEKADLLAALSELKCCKNLREGQYLRVAGFYRRIGEYSSSLQIYEMLEKQGCGGAMVTFLKGVIYSRMDLFDKSEKAAREVITLKPTEERAYLLLAKVLYSKGDKISAGNWLNRFHELTGGTRNSHRFYRVANFGNSQKS